MTKTNLIIAIVFMTSNLYGQSGTSKLVSWEAFIEDQWVIPQNGIAPVNVNESGDFDSTIISNIGYPMTVRKMGIEGDLLPALIIDKNGKMESYRIYNSVGADCHIEIRNLVTRLPATWEPAKVGGENVVSFIKILIKFTLDDTDYIETTQRIYKCYKV